VRVRVWVGARDRARPLTLSMGRSVSGRYTGDIREIWGRYKGDLGEIQGGALALSMGRSVRGQSRKPVMLRKVTWVGLGLGLGLVMLRKVTWLGGVAVGVGLGLLE